MEFVVPVALVRENLLAHAIWTVAIVSHAVVPDHHRHHSSGMEQVEAPVVEIADAIAHAMYFRLSLFFLYHQTVKVLEAILAKVQADVAVQEVQDVPEVHKVQEEHWGETLADTDSSSHLLLHFRLQSRLTSRIFFPKHDNSTHADETRC